MKGTEDEVIRDPNKQKPASPIAAAEDKYSTDNDKNTQD
jgi:hypothetical protein